MRLLLGLLGLWATSIPAAAQSPSEKNAPVEALVLGTYHFASPGRDIYNPTVDDVLKPARQAELRRLTDALAEFRPTKVMTERMVNDTSPVDPAFASFTLSDLAKDRDERVQVAYRLARQAGVPVFGIDEQPSKGEPDYFPFQPVVDWAKANGARSRLDALMAKAAATANKLEEDQKTRTIPQMLLDRNRPDAIAEEQDIYYALLAFGGTDQQPGADLNAMWYLRNAKIFAKVMTVAEPGDRIVVVYGLGHNHWLRHFAATVPGYKLVEAVPYLEKAAR